MVGSVGVIGKEELCEKVVEVRRISDRVIIVVIFYVVVLKLNCGYAPQSGSFEEKQSSYDELKGELDMHSVGDLAMCLGDAIGHVGRHIDGFDGDHGGYGVCPRTLEGRMLSEFCLEKELFVSNTWSTREEKRKVTF